jgi:ubiquinone biosynthesis protein COQ9
MNKIVSSNIGRNLIRNLNSNKQTQLNHFIIAYKFSSESKNNEESSKTDESQHETPKLTEEQIKEKILSNAMKHVPNLGFSNDALTQGFR